MTTARQFELTGCFSIQRKRFTPAIGRPPIFQALREGREVRIFDACLIRR
jgi:hypothetical protein